MRSSTSWHTMSADKRLSKVERIVWLGLNIANNTFPRWNVDSRLIERKFRIEQEELDRLWDSIAEAQSPSRRLCDLFWATLPWDRISNELGYLRILEIGCGDGVYGRLLRRLTGGSFERYLGVDVEANQSWDSTSHDAGFRFAVGDAGEADKYLPGSNFLLTQSALEHFEADLRYFRHVAEFVRSADQPTFQVHLVPSASCIWTFPWHGVREYTPRTLSKIARLFDDDTTVYLFSLGNDRCNAVHRNYITWPLLWRREDLRDVEIEDYRQAVRSAILADSDDDGRSPAFYALVIVSGFKKDVFQ